MKTVPNPSGHVSALVLDAVIAAAASRYHCAPVLILNRDRSRPQVHARQYAIWLLRQMRRADGLPRYSLPGIARAVGLTDHTTALHAIRAVQKRGEARL